MKIPLKPLASFCFVFLTALNTLKAQTQTNFIVIDQFGYLPDAPKVAVIRDPLTGYDAAEAFTPGVTYAVVDAEGTQVYTGSVQAWGGGAEDASSGDRAWWFDFSSVQTPGEYYILDVDNNVRSYSFKVGEAVYNEVLRQAVRTFFYQRAGFAKNAPYAEEGWTDAASHMQDMQARIYNDKNNPATEKDLHGGWYDAGDYNKYTNWTAGYVVDMMKAYIERPEAWTDDYNIPESGNGVPDLLDEAKWGIDFLLRMQQNDGSVLSIVGVDHASPPSAATDPSYYGSPNTSSTQNTAAAFAIASKAFRSVGMDDYADTLVKRAEMAWDWSEANPNVLFYNNDAGSGTSGLGAGQQEEDDYGRSMGRLRAACFLYEATGDVVYRNYFDSNYQDAHLLQWTYAYPFEAGIQETLLYYTLVPGATSTVVTNIRNTYNTAMNGSDNFGAYNNETDPYRAYLKDYTWGSNNVKTLQGSMFYDMISYNVDAAKAADAEDAAVGYINYIHGVNPLNFVYLSNMSKHGAENSVNEFYHSWFYDGNPTWDRVGVSTYGPAPGFLTGGPNPSYDWDGCCPSGCGSSANNAICTSESITPPKGQPAQKSYKDFNTSWPLNSWSVTENSDGYQIGYIRLLSKFVNMDYDCNNELNGTAFYNDCGVCVGGSTGLPASPDCVISGIPGGTNVSDAVHIYPNPNTGSFSFRNIPQASYKLTVTDLTGKPVKSLELKKGQTNVDISDLPDGSYILKFTGGNQMFVKQVTKM